MSRISKSADFRPFPALAELEFGDTAGWETCATGFCRGLIPKCVQYATNRPSTPALSPPSRERVSAGRVRGTAGRDVRLKANQYQILNSSPGEQAIAAGKWCATATKPSRGRSSEGLAHALDELHHRRRVCRERKGRSTRGFPHDHRQKPNSRFHHGN